jgi:Domain of unknown function (DUF4440)
VSDREDVLAAAHERADALGRGDVVGLERLLHPEFGWVSHRGEFLDRAGYLASNTSGRNRWYGQELTDMSLAVVGDVAILRCTVADDVDTGSGRHAYRMPMTQTWVRADGRWQCLAGHAGPLSET